MRSFDVAAAERRRRLEQCPADPRGHEPGPDGTCKRCCRELGAALRAHRPSRAAAIALADRHAGEVAE